MKVAQVCLAVMAVLLMYGSSEVAGKKVVCYYTNWSTYRPGLGQFKPKDIDPTLCTHVLYSFLIAQDSKVTIHDNWIDVESGYMDAVVGMKSQNPNLKVMMAVGGWNNGGWAFHNMAKTAAGRKMFIDSAIDLITKYKFDGVDLDWEYPGLRGGDPSVDKTNFNKLIQEFQLAFRNYAIQTGMEKPLLSAAVGPAPKTADVAYDKATVCSELDFVNLMHYDIHGAWEMQTGYLAPLRVTPGETTPENVLDAMTENWINAGCARDKLIFGLPLYGRGWTTNSNSNTVPSSATGPSTQGQYSRAAGMLSYYEICEKLSNGWQESYNSQAEQSIAYGDGQLVTYDNERSIKAKVDYLNQMNLGGAMIWALDFDDFTGQFCNRGKYPLLKAINKQLGITPPPTTRRPPTTSTQPHSTTTTNPGCTQWWCPPKKTTTTTTTTTTVSPTGECKLPVCNQSKHGQYLADTCNARRFYVCGHGNLYVFYCPRRTRFEQSCSCCIKKN